MCVHMHTLVNPLPHTAAALDSLGSSNSCLWEGKNLQVDGSLSLKGPFSPECPIKMGSPGRPGGVGHVGSRGRQQPLWMAFIMVYGGRGQQSQVHGSRRSGSKGKLDQKQTWAHLCPQLSSWAQLAPPKWPAFPPHALPIPSIPKPP